MLKYHSPGAERILEIPIYRCTDEQHRNEEDRRFEERTFPFEEQFHRGARSPERIAIWKKYRHDAYSRAVTLWDFNQIVGWIRLYIWPGHIRAYLFLTQERISKVMRRKTFQTLRGNFVEMGVYPTQSNEEILAKLMAAIRGAVKDHRGLRRCYVDTGVLDTLGPHIDWLGLVRPATPVPFERERFWADLAAQRRSD